VVTLARTGGRAESVGIVVDHVRAVMRIDRESQDQMPALLSKSGTANQIQTVCRLDGGKRLISVLNEQALFSHEAVRSAVESAKQEGGEQQVQSERETQDTREDDENKLVVFLLAEQEFGVIVESVQEIIRVPEEMSRVPKTPAFIEGMVNLRGAVLPVIDIRPCARPSTPKTAWPRWSSRSRSRPTFSWSTSTCPRWTATPCCPGSAPSPA
jgi:purine-binding chemotaxis protein CheW